MMLLEYPSDFLQGNKTTRDRIAGPYGVHIFRFIKSGFTNAKLIFIVVV